MKVYIDQSGKVEYTSQDTVVALSNGGSASLKIKASEKRKIQNSFRQAGKPEIFVYKTFTALLYLLIKDSLNKTSCFVIDKEYWRKESLIKDFLLQVIRAAGHRSFDREKIVFGLVGRNRNCHILAISVLRKTVKADKIVKAGDILSLVL
ncbi:MAG: hypothetical protein M1484_03850 [Patescibacteria group bacterium]|nr:hypothetical protein [Patescibacteria group bacterium]MCL5432195.1 hypothetical protein [Patescibacteria group bacterium]